MWQLAVYDRRQHEQFSLAEGRGLLSRADADAPWQFMPGDSAHSSQQSLSLRTEGERLSIVCRGIDDPLETERGSFHAAVRTEVPLPAIVRLGSTWIEVRQAAPIESLELEPLHGQAAEAARAATLSPMPGPDAETIAAWLAAVGQIHRTAACSPDFFRVAARATLGSTGLDAAMILVPQDKGWQIAGGAVTHPEHGVAFERAAVSLLAERPEVWRRPSRPSDLGLSASESSPESRESIVVAPIRDDAGALVAAIYGVRHGQGHNRRRGIRPLEARVVELLAEAVGAGMARRQQELDAARQQVLLEQAFAPQVIEHLQRRPQALVGQTRDVTMLFADLRGFSSIAENMAPDAVYELLASVMEPLTQAVIDHGGVIVDYYGDGLCALWNAPLDVPDHADRACSAALAMLAAMPKLNRRWHSVVARPLELGVGVHSGSVQVGNAGSARRLKYGPRGAAVNVASRVQGATKQFDVGLLITDAVRRRLSPHFVTLKVCTARLPGFEQPLDLFMAFPATDAAQLQSDLDAYAEALASFEEGDLDAAEQALAALVARGPATPAEFLAEQTAALRHAALGRRAADKLGCTSDAVIEILSK